MKKKPSFSEENQKDVELKATESVSPTESTSLAPQPAPPTSQPEPAPKPKSRAKPKIGSNTWLFLAALALAISLANVNEWIGKSNSYTMVRYNVEQFPIEQLPLLLLQQRLRAARESLVGDHHSKVASLTDLANLELMSGDEAAAESHLLQAVPAPAEGNAIASEQLDTLLQLYSHQQRWQTAASLIDKYKLMPDSPLDPLNLKRIAVILDHVGRPAEAEKFRQFYDSHGQLRLSRSMKAGTSSDIPPSESRKILIDMFDKTAQDDILSMGCTLLACNRFEESRHCFQTIANRQIQPPGPTTMSSDPEPLYQQKAAIVMLPITSMLMNDYKRAEAEFPKALEIDRNVLRGGQWFPVQPLLFQQYSRFLMHKGNVSEAKKYAAMSEEARLKQEDELHRLWWKTRSAK